MDGEPSGKVGVQHHGQRAFRRYVVNGERLVFTTHKHWVTLLEPAASAVLSLPLVVVLIWRLEEKLGDIVLVLFFGWLVLVGRLGVHVFEWHDTWFASTSRRLLLQHGLLTHKVAMMPLEKVTDMSYTRSALGQLLGYGQFVLESAGQDQALRVITHVPHPDETYQVLCTTMFGPKDEPVKPAEPEPEPDGGRDVDPFAEGVRAYPADEWEDPWEAELPPSFPPAAAAAPRPVPSGRDADTQVLSRDAIDRERWLDD